MYFNKIITGKVVLVSRLTIPNFPRSDNASQLFEQVTASKAVVAQTRPLHRTSLFVCLSDHNGNGLTIPNFHHSDKLSQPFEQVASGKAVVAQTRALRRTSLFMLF